MARINDHYRKLKAGYLFPEIGRRVAAFCARHPTRRSSGWASATSPSRCRRRDRGHARGRRRDGRRETFRGYGPEQGYDFLREAIAENDYRSRGCDSRRRRDLRLRRLQVRHAATSSKSSAPTTRIAVTDPVYPVYVDTNVMAGRTGAADDDGRYAGLVYLAGHGRRTTSSPAVPEQQVDLIYLCYPEQPHRRGRDARAAAAWVDYARANDAVILFDAAYEAYIPTPRSRTRSTRSRARATWRSSSAASPRPPASPACAARSPSSPSR